MGIHHDRQRKAPEPHIRMKPGFEEAWPGASALSTECVLNLHLLAERMSAFAEALMRRHGLPSRAAFNVLTVIEGAGQPLPPSVIAERMIVTRPTISGVLDSMNRHGLVRRVPHPADRRMTLIESTPSGRERMRSVRLLLHQAERQWMGCLTRAQQRVLLRMLARLQANAPPG